MHIAVPSPPPEGLAKEVDQNTKTTKQEDQTHIQHDRRHISISDDPWGNKIAEAVSPYVLVYSNGDEYAACNRLVAVHRVGGGNCRYGGNLDSGASVANDDDGLNSKLVPYGYSFWKDNYSPPTAICTGSRTRRRSC